jgi:serine phosphatase RsbU (regulator of sigma subunit)
MTGLHENLSGTRGAAAGIGMIDLVNGQLSYCGVGNIVTRKIGNRSMHLSTTEGIVGQSIKRLSPETVMMESSDLLLMYTDGIPDRFSAEALVGLGSRDAWAIARHLVKDFGKAIDDATCIALRYQQ